MLTVRPKIAELAFRVFSRCLHPELYTVVQRRRVEREQYQATIEITNCGHVITWNGIGVTLCEVATSASQPLPDRRCLVTCPIKGCHADRAVHAGVQYRTSFQLEFVAPEMFRLVGKSLASESTQGLLHRFDSSGRMELGAISYINVESRKQSLLVQAIHTFPDDYAILKIESQIAFSK